MEKKPEIKRIYREAFNDSEKYIDMYFRRVYREDEAFVYTFENKIVSSLMLRKYKMNFCGNDCDISYLAAVATSKLYRGRGFMKELIRSSLGASRERGDLFATLIPAQKWLYDYYEQFGFTAVFYVEERRYTSLHSFLFKCGYTVAGDIATDEVYAAFDRMMHMRRNCVQHSREDYNDILIDNELDDGKIAVMRNQATSEIDAIAFGALRDDNLVVKDVLSVNDDAANAALSILSSNYPNTSIVIMAMPAENSFLPIEPRGMARIVNVGKVLGVFASTYPDLRKTIRVTDPIIKENSHIYFIDNGSCVINDGFMGNVDLDVTVDVLTSILFSSEKVGEIFNLPTHRPYISLMLD